MADIDALLAIMPRVGASDMHLSPGHKPMLRLHGSMVRNDKERVLDAEEIGRLVGEIMPERNRAEFDEQHDTDFAYEARGIGRFRVNVYQGRLGVSAALRLIPDQIRSLEQLGLPPVVTEFCRLQKGLVVVTGPTGSGKSTTLAAMLDHINRTRSQHVITIEDPIEFVHASRGCLVHQREVGAHARSFRRALRAALREDPDVIMVGELRDLETMRSAIELAATGHLVLGTLHTETAAGAVDRIIDQYPHGEQQQVRTMLAQSLKGVIAQTLLATADGKGRVGAYEVLVVTSAVANHIREGKTHAIASAMQTGTKFGMVELGDALLALVRDGTVAPQEAYLHAADKADLLARLHAHGIAFDPRKLTRLEHATVAERESRADDFEPGTQVGGAALRTSNRRGRRRSKPARFDDFESFRAARLAERDT